MVVYSGDSATLKSDEETLEKYIGVSEGGPQGAGQTKRSH
jgi:hypothetical protein